MKKQSKYWKKKLRSEKVYVEKDWTDNNGNAYETKRQAQVSSFINWFRGCTKTGFTITVGPWFWYSAIAIFPFVFIRRDQITIERLNHEKIHIRQMWDLLIVGAYIWYPVELYVRIIGNLVNLVSRTFHSDKSIIAQAYWDHSMEREARDNQGNKNYLFERKRFAFLKYI